MLYLRCVSHRERLDLYALFGRSASTQEQPPTATDFDQILKKIENNSYTTETEFCVRPYFIEADFSERLCFSLY